jgi:hypothetical protein
VCRMHSAEAICQVTNMDAAAGRGVDGHV